MGGLLPLFLLVAPLAIAIWDRSQTGSGTTAYVPRDRQDVGDFDRAEMGSSAI